MEHYTLIKKTIKKRDKNETKQEPPKSKSAYLKNKRANIRDVSKIILKCQRFPEKTISLEEPLPNFLHEPQEYLKFPEVPVYEPTVVEFRNPISLINKLREMGFEKFGCVKLKAPKEWNPTFSLALQDKKITTRKQVLQDLIKGKCFKQNVNSYTLNEFEEFAANFSKDYQKKSDSQFENVYRNNEYEYWLNVEDPACQKDKVIVEYAADLPSIRYGSAFPTLHRNQMSEVSHVDDERIHPFNLNNIVHTENSLFQFLTRKSESISGITSPWVYAGMLFASFCWHVEDLYMYSINYHHKGAAKTWYVVPQDYKEQLELVIKEKYGELFIYNPDLLYNITLTMNPLELLKRNIPVYRTEQQPREFIITFPKAYHAGFSHGFNIGEAVNIATTDWIPYEKQAVQDYASEGFSKKGSFPFEWLIVENVKRIHDFNYTPEAKKQIAEAYLEIMAKELKDREMIKSCYSKVKTKQYGDLTSRYDSHICGTCKNYTYLSFLTCLVCRRHCCTSHITICDCLNTPVTLNVRFSDQNLKDFAQSVEKSMNLNKSS